MKKLIKTALFIILLSCGTQVKSVNPLIEQTRQFVYSYLLNDSGLSGESIAIFLPQIEAAQSKAILQSILGAIMHEQALLPQNQMPQEMPQGGYVIAPHQ